MAYNNAYDYLIAGNDEHGINPPTPGKRTPMMPYIDRQIYENEFNYAAKNAFLADCLRVGFRIFDVKPNRPDLSVSNRVANVNRSGANAVVTFAYNAYGDGTTFNNANGIEGYYAPLNIYPNQSSRFANLIYDRILANTGLNGRGVGTLDVGMLSNVRCVAGLFECGFMTNFREAKLMLDPDYHLAVGRGACQGVCEYFNVEYVDIQNQNFPTLRQGSTGRYVRYLQFMLKTKGYAVGNVDGVFGVNTRSAVQAFQQANGLTVDGIVGKNTWYKLNNLTPEARVLRLGDYGAEVKYLQQKLYSKLYNVGPIDGIFGQQTQQAVKEFQSENGLFVDGIVGRDTWRAILNNNNSRPLII